MKQHLIKLRKNDDLRQEIESYCRREQVKAAYIGTCVGSLQNVRLRKGSTKSTCTIEGPFEICALSGTLSTSESHLHISISDEDYQVLGGHLIYGTLVLNTAEIVIVELDYYEIIRDRSEGNDYKELKITKMEGGN